VRPVELTVDGFTCFRDPQEALDFRSLDLFAITGPTGAGKSSVLDAMTYALYAKVPRLGRRGVRELISQLRDQMVVRFDFRLGARQYRVTRRTRRRGGAEAMLVEVSDGVERPVADGVREVNQRIEALLGLSYDAFQQAVVLPQGQFDQFLRSDPAQRRDILRALLRLEVYERMRERAHERARWLAQEVAAATKSLDAGFAGVTEDSVTALRAELDGAEAGLRARGSALDAAEAELVRLRPLRTATIERADVETRLAVYAAADAEVDLSRRRLGRARAAGTVMPALQAAQAATARAEQEAGRAALAAAEVERLSQLAAAAQAALASAGEARARLPALRQRVQALDRVLGTLGQRDALAARVTAQEQERTAAVQALDEQQTSRTALDRRRAEADTDHQAARAALSAIAYDAARHTALEGWRDAATEVARLRTRCAELDAAAANATKAAGSATTKARTTATAAERARKALDDATGRHAAAVLGHERLRDAHAAAHLRQALEPGAPCPVCEQVVRVVPAGGVVPALDAARLEVERLEQHQAQAQQKAAAAAREAAGAQAVATRAEADRRAAETAQAGGVTRLTAGVARLTAGLSAIGVVSGERAPEVFVAESLTALAAARSEHDAAAEVARRTERALIDLQHTLEVADQQIASGTARVEGVDASLTQDRAELARVRAAILVVCPEGDPAAERSSAAARVEEVARAWDAALTAVHDAEQRLSAAGAAASAARRVADEAVAMAGRDRAAAQQAVAAAGFAAADEARAAVLPEREMTALAERVEAHARERAALHRRLEELAVVLAGGEVSADQMSAAETGAAQAKAARDAAMTRAAALRQRLQIDEGRLATAIGLRAQRGRHVAEHAVADRLATDLRSDAFQEYLLQEVFERLVGDASARLHAMTGRYALEWDKGEFLVVDHDNAGERRIAQTLSGGETFLTSLSLALALSEQVQRTAGAVGLDSLFIDEGFGTLDADTLDVATEAIESLQVGGRMVGVISHLRELTDRMPACIVIDKRPEGSRWGIVRN
jgi:exonuclease SbcC